MRLTFLGFVAAATFALASVGLVAVGLAGDAAKTAPTALSPHPHFNEPMRSDWPDEAAAVAALSVACVAYGRKVAGLPAHRIARFACHHGDVGLRAVRVLR